MSRDEPGYVYLVHLESKMGRTQHYRGWAQDVPARLEQHRASTWVECEPYQTEKYGIAHGRKHGQGATYLAVANSRGIAWTLARVWIGDRDLENTLKARKDGAALCPICSGQAAYRRAAQDEAASIPAASDLFARAKVEAEVEIPF